MRQSTKAYRQKCVISLLILYLLYAFTPFWYNSLQVVTKGVWSGGDLLEYTTDHRLLQRFRFDGLIEFDHARFAEFV
jgi:hypothetical protein